MALPFLVPMLLGAVASVGERKIWAIPHDEKLVTMLQKRGYKIIDKVTILEKEL